MQLRSEKERLTIATFLFIMYELLKILTEKIPC